jgi:hypothetical protein
VISSVMRDGGYCGDGAGVLGEPRDYRGKTVGSVPGDGRTIIADDVRTSSWTRDAKVGDLRRPPTDGGASYPRSGGAARSAEIRMNAIGRSTSAVARKGKASVQRTNSRSPVADETNFDTMIG